MRFVVVFLGTVLVLLLGAAAVNAAVNPYAIYPTRWFPPAAGNDLDRALRLLENPQLQPELVVFGSSRSSRLRPKDLECFSGLTSANAAFSNATPDAVYALAHFMLDTKPAPKTMILGVDVEAFQDAAKFGDRLASVPRLGKYLKADSVQQYWFDGTQLLSFGQLNDSVRVLQHTVEANLPQQTVSEDNAPPLQIIENRDEDTPKKALTSYQKRFVNYPAPDAQQLEYFRSLVQLASDKHIHLKIFITPLSPTLTEVLNKQGIYPKRLAQVDQWLRELQGQYPFEFYNFSTIQAFGGNDKDFYNLAHIDDVNSARLIGAMYTEAGRAAQCAPK